MPECVCLFRVLPKKKKTLRFQGGLTSQRAPINIECALFPHARPSLCVCACDRVCSPAITSLLLQPSKTGREAMGVCKVVVVRGGMESDCSEKHDYDHL